MTELYCIWNFKNIHKLAAIIEENKDLPIIPREIWLYIEECMRENDRQESNQFYKTYFTSEDCLLQLRYKTRSGKQYYYDNTASCFHSDFTKIIAIFRKMLPMTHTHENIKELYHNINSFTNLIYKWYFWLYDHQYKSTYSDFKSILVNKIYKFYDDLNNKLSELSLGASDKRLDYLNAAIESMKNCIYFVETYHPFKLNFQLGNVNREHLDKYYSMVKHSWDPQDRDYYTDVMRAAYYENDLDSQIQKYHKIQDLYDEISYFEGYIYDYEYYFNILENKCMKLRNGKYILCEGKTPRYFWKNNVIYRIYASDF